MIVGYGSKHLRGFFVRCRLGNLEGPSDVVLVVGRTIKRILSHCLSQLLRTAYQKDEDVAGGL